MYNVQEACIEALQSFQKPNEFWDSELTVNLIETYLSDDINSIVSNSDKYGFSCFTKKNLNKFLEKLENAYYLETKDLDKLTRELYLLHQICNGLFEYYEAHLTLPYDKFRSKILLPNLVYILVRHYHKAQGFLQSTIRCVYNEHKVKNGGLISKLTNSYYIDEDIIKTDVLYQFLGNALRKFNPQTILNLNHFYRQTFRNIFYYYFKVDYQLDHSYSDFSDIDFSLGKNINIPIRLSYYRSVLYNLQIKKMCKSSSTLRQLSYNYNIFKNIILNNEFQDMYYSLHQDSFMLKNNQYKLLNIYDNNHNDFMNELKELPMIYKMLRSIHVINPKSKPHNEVDIKASHVKSIILAELSHPFKNLFNEQNVYAILEKTSNNFVDNVLCGEYINPINFSTIKINNYSFVTQLKQFVQLCLKESGVSS